MTTDQIHSTFKLILKQLSLRQLMSAINNIRVLSNELQIGEYIDRLTDLEQNYRLLLQYYVSGIDDPERKSVYNRQIAKLFLLNYQLREELMLRSSSNFEYSHKRYFPHTKKFNTIIELHQWLEHYHWEKEKLGHVIVENKQELLLNRENYELVIAELFTHYWLTTEFLKTDKDLFISILNKSESWWIEQTVLISALTMNLWRMFDESKLLSLLDACLHKDIRISQRALVGICFVLAKHNRFLTYFPSIRGRLVLLSDNNHIINNLQNIIIQIIATTDTEKITKKMQDEILPEMMKIGPKLKDKLDENNKILSDDWDEENPEWQEMLEQSGISDKLKELSELQMEGADIYMSTFSVLKSFPFFSTISNWFLPFDMENSQVNTLFDKEDKNFLSAFVNNGIMCNSDKYSFCLSIMRMPDSQREIVKSSFKQESEQLEEITKDEALLTPNVAAKNISKQYIQDLFRFFKLFPQHADFSDMFSLSLILHKTYLFDILSISSTFKPSIAEYYFSKNKYEQALDVFHEIEKEIIPTASLYQKIGYSYQQLGQFTNALEAYQKADMILPDDLWTIKKIAYCNKEQENYIQAIEYYELAKSIKPEQRSIEFQLGYCYMMLKKYKEALAIFIKMDALLDGDRKVWQAITWCSFVSSNIEQAAYYSKKLIENTPSMNDYLNAGHIAWCQHNLQMTLNYYRKSMEIGGADLNSFSGILQRDKLYLQTNGIDPDEISLILDTLSE